MQVLTFDSAAADIGAQISDNAWRGLQAGRTAANGLSALAPAGAEEVSAQAVMAFTSDAAQMMAVNRAAQEELMRAGDAIIEIARMYSAVDAEAAASVIDAGMQWGSRMAI
ncbi:PE domain-containing protein [Mycobacterium asiaticum]|uniref:PE family protein n=1 Tax=Mycobacterium asiaticum TaxID=1790 RepID=A0A1A3N4M9_MYCAS|nr:PE domain-containing protein [Mycobacterium asiaticum]OBK17093.1 PE family protein [Mycobacterium asiaticum]